MEHGARSRAVDEVSRLERRSIILVRLLMSQGSEQDYSQCVQVHHGGLCPYHGAGCLEGRGLARGL
jgi:hypothetical protein